MRVGRTSKVTQATSPLTPPPADTVVAQRGAWLAYISWQILACSRNRLVSGLPLLIVRRTRDQEGPQGGQQVEKGPRKEACPASSQTQAKMHRRLLEPDASRAEKRELRLAVGWDLLQRSPRACTLAREAARSVRGGSLSF